MCAPRACVGRQNAQAHDVCRVWGSKRRAVLARSHTRGHTRTHTQEHTHTHTLTHTHTRTRLRTRSVGRRQGVVSRTPQHVLAIQSQVCSVIKTACTADQGSCPASRLAQAALRCIPLCAATATTRTHTEQMRAHRGPGKPHAAGAPDHEAPTARATISSTHWACSMHTRTRHSRPQHATAWHGEAQCNAPERITGRHHRQHAGTPGSAHSTPPQRIT